MDRQTNLTGASPRAERTAFRLWTVLYVGGQIWRSFTIGMLAKLLAGYRQAQQAREDS